MNDKNETYYVWDLQRHAPGVPGEVVRIRVRARDEAYARYCAAAHRGNESDQEWLDRSKSSAEIRCKAEFQHAGVVRVLGFGHHVEKARITMTDRLTEPAAIEVDEEPPVDPEVDDGGEDVDDGDDDDGDDDDSDDDDGDDDDSDDGDEEPTVDPEDEAALGGPLVAEA